MFSSVQSLRCVRFFVTPGDHSTRGLPVHYQLPEFTQTHVHWVSDAIQPSHPLSTHSPPAFNLSSGSFPVSQLFVSGGQSIGVSASASVIPVNIQDWSPLGFRASAVAIHSGELFPPRYPSPGPPSHLPVSLKCPLLSSHLKTATLLLTHFLISLKSIMLLLMLLSCFSHIRLCVTP